MDKLNNKINSLKFNIKIGIVGKYIELEDSYYSVMEALNYAGWYYNTKINIEWINVRKSDDISTMFKDIDCVPVPGGFGTSGIENIIISINHCRIYNIPFMGICLECNYQLLNLPEMF